MIILAIEQSTPAATAGIYRDGEPLAEQAWDARGAGRQQLVPALGAMREAAGIEWPDIDAYVVGTGPGSFAGIRTALAAAGGLALPDGRPLHGIPSPEVIGEELAKTVPVTVVGDARRQCLWAASYRRESDRLIALTPPALYPRDGWPHELPPQGLLVSPDWDRIGDVLEDIRPDGMTLRTSVCSPSATALQALAFSRLSRGEPLAPPQPVYLHPPVFDHAKPREGA